MVKPQKASFESSLWSRPPSRRVLRSRILESLSSPLSFPVLPRSERGLQCPTTHWIPRKLSLTPPFPSLDKVQVSNLSDFPRHEAPDFPLLSPWTFSSCFCRKASHLFLPDASPQPFSRPRENVEIGPSESDLYRVPLLEFAQEGVVNLQVGSLSTFWPSAPHVPSSALYNQRRSTVAGFSISSSTRWSSRRPEYLIFSNTSRFFLSERT